MHKTKKYKFTNKTHKTKTKKQNTNSCKIFTNIQKQILHLYFGITYIIINNNYEKNENKVKLIDLNLYYGKTNKEDKILNTSRTFTEIDTCEVFFNTSININDNYKFIEINEHNNTNLCIFFLTGDMKFYKNNISVSEYLYIDEIIENNKKIYKPRYYELIIVICKLLKYIKTNKYKKILLCGHSNGATTSLYFAYVLLILSSNEKILNLLPKHHKVFEFINNIKTFMLTSKYKDDLLINSNDILNLNKINNLIRNNIYICGTGGYPILWKNYSEINIFNKFYKQKYLHIISGYNNNNFNYIDNRTYYSLSRYIQLNIKNINEDKYINKKEKDKKIKEQYKIKNLNKTYFNYGSIIFTKNKENNIHCYKIDNIVKQLDIITKNNIISKNIFDKNYYLYNDIHKFSFYKYLYNKFTNQNVNDWNFDFTE